MDAVTPEAQRLAEECKSLLTAATNATFDCGEWSGESAAGNEEPERAYGPLAQAALDAKAAVHAAIDRLASLIPPGGLAEETLEESAQRRHQAKCAAIPFPSIETIDDKRAAQRYRFLMSGKSRFDVYEDGCNVSGEYANMNIAHEIKAAEALQAQPKGG